MVDLSQVKMPVVEYEDGTREPLEHFYLSADDGDFCVNGRFFEANGDTYRGGAKITAIHPAEPAANGWVSFNGAFVRDYGDSTVCIEDTEIGFQAIALGGEQPFEWDIGMCKTADECCAALDAAYASHVAAKPVLAWDDSLAFLKRARHIHHEYIVNSLGDRGDRQFAAEHHTPSSRSGLGRYATEEEAKAACERHAKGE